MQCAISFRNMCYIYLYLLFPNPNISSPTIVLYITRKLNLRYLNPISMYLGVISPLDRALMNRMIVLPAFRFCFFNHLKHFTNGSRETFRTSGDCRTSTKALVVPCFFIGVNLELICSFHPCIERFVRHVCDISSQSPAIAADLLSGLRAMAKTVIH